MKTLQSELNRTGLVKKNHSSISKNNIDIVVIWILC